MLFIGRLTGVSFAALFLAQGRDRTYYCAENTEVLITWPRDKFVWYKPLIIGRRYAGKPDVINSDGRVVVKYHQLVSTHRLTSTQRHQMFSRS